MDIQTRCIHTFVEIGGAAEAGSGFNMDGSDAAGVGVWRFADERASDAFRWREEGEPICILLLLVVVEGVAESARFLGCECECECGGCGLREGNFEFTVGEEDP
jgi:hypothetical protein